MAPEAAVRKETGKRIVGDIIDATILKLQRGQYPNALRGINHAANEIQATLAKNGLPPGEFIMAGTIGDINPTLMAKDPLEAPRYGRLEADMIMDPSSPEFARAQETERQILADYRERGINMFGYDSDARGTPESRELFRKEAQAIGLQTESVEQVWLGDGGMGILPRAFRTLHNMHKAQGRNGILLSPSVCFSMATNSAADNGLDVAYVETSDAPHQVINSAALEKYFQGGGMVPDVALLTPTENPAARSHEPETLRGVITLLKAKNPNITFLFDMAYMSMIPRQRAREIMNVINETGAADQAIFAFSESKRLGEPRLRAGAAIIRNKQLGALFQKDTIRNYSSYSWRPDVWLQVLDRELPEATLEEFNSLLRERQQALLEVLRRLDPAGAYFTDLDRICIPGYGKINPEAVEQDNPLYLYVQLREGVSALENVAKDLGIFGIPGDVFGDSRSHMRFSLGVVSLSDIRARIPEEAL